MTRLPRRGKRVTRFLPRNLRNTRRLLQMNFRLLQNGTITLTLVPRSDNRHKNTRDRLYLGGDIIGRRLTQLPLTSTNTTIYTKSRTSFDPNLLLRLHNGTYNGIYTTTEGYALYRHTICISKLARKLPTPRTRRGTIQNDSNILRNRVTPPYRIELSRRWGQTSTLHYLVRAVISP